VHGLPLDARQTEELILTSAQSLFAAIVIADLRFSRPEAIALAVLFGGQFLFTSTEVRYLFTAFYLLLSALMLLSAERRRVFFGLLFSAPHSEHPGGERE
jgi:cation:H+ antiporter